MEIRKIFSNVEDPEESLYSVLMTEDEVALFSEIQKEFSLQSALREAAMKVAKTPEARKIAGAARGYAHDVTGAFKRFGGTAVGRSGKYFQDVSPELGKLISKGGSKAKSAIDRTASKVAENGSYLGEHYKNGAKKIKDISPKEFMKYFR